MLQQQNPVVVTENSWPTQPKIFAIWPLTRKLCQSLVYSVNTCFPNKDPSDQFAVVKTTKFIFSKEFSFNLMRWTL
jgi:hypothetical protein